jgi:uncharacterized protein YjiS (DUF1127 family)
MFRQMLQRLAEYRRRQRAYDELASLDDRSLADIGITRADIPFVLARRDERQPASNSARLGAVSHAAR